MRNRVEFRATQPDGSTALMGSFYVDARDNIVFASVDGGVWNSFFEGVRNTPCFDPEIEGPVFSNELPERWLELLPSAYSGSMIRAEAK